MRRRSTLLVERTQTWCHAVVEQEKVRKTMKLEPHGEDRGR
jgi:hypothetical protein